MLAYFETLFRSALAFTVLLVMWRFLGQPLKTLIGAAMGGLLAWLAMDRELNAFHALLSIIIWTVLTLVVGWVSLRWPQFRDFAYGKPTPLIENGKVLENNLRKSRMTAHDLMALLREKDAFKVSDVEFAALEGDGQLSVLLKPDIQPLTPKTVNLATTPEREPYVVIVDGQLQPTALAESGFDRAHLLQQIQAKGASSFSDVYLAQIDSQGKVQIDLYDDLRPLPQDANIAKPLVLATLKKIQADLEIFALQTEHPEAKQQYAADAVKLHSLIRALTPHLLA